jgi:hypothetical protein
MFAVAIGEYPQDRDFIVVDLRTTGSFGLALSHAQSDRTEDVT